ncbi:MAG: hypothetical protein AAB969_01110 [Patescibacteria group bacterium]
MSDRVSTAEKMKALEVQLQYLQKRNRELTYKLQAESSSNIAKDQSLRLAQAEFDELTEKISVIELEMEKLEIIQQIEEKMKIAKALMPIGKFAIDGFKGEVGEIISELMSALLDVRENIDGQLARLSQIKANGLFRQYAYLKGAGFNGEQAFMLTLASVHPINWSEMAQRTSQSATSASLSKRD